MDLILLLGLVAGTLTTVAYVPQALKIWRTHSSTDVSSTMYIIVSTGLLLWTIYGVYVNSLPLILSDIVSLALAIAILVLKQKYP